MKLDMHLTEEEKALPPKKFVETVLDAEISAYGQWLKERDQKGDLGPFEKDILRSFLWWKAGR
jgi:hypothetical protein